MGIWSKYGTVIFNPATDTNSGTGFGGTSNGDVLYEANPQLITANPDGKVFKLWFMVNNDLWYAEANRAQGPWTRSGSAVILNFGLSKIYKSGSTYYIYGCSPAYAATPTAILVYTSSNGTTWSSQGTAMSVGAAGHWDSTSVQYFKPFYFDGTTYYATYSGTGGTFGTGIATTTNLLSWTNSPNTVIPGVGGPCPIRTSDGRFYVLTSVLNPPAAADYACGLVSSSDMVNWSSQRLIFPPTMLNEGTANPSTAEGIGVPVPIEVNGISYVFYTGAVDGTGKHYRMMVATAAMPLVQALANPGGLVTYTTSTTQTASDSFQRANEAPLSDGGAWGQAGGVYFETDLVSDKAVATNVNSSSHAIWNGPPTIGNDHYSEVTLATNSVSSVWNFGANARETATVNNFYIFSSGSGGGWALSAVYGGTVGEPFMSGTLAVPAIGTKFRLVASGSVLMGYINGALVATAQDSTLQTGKPSMTMYDGTTPNSTAVSLWTGGTASVQVQNPYSVPDCRNYSIFPNSAVPTNGTNIYTGQTSSNSTIPPVDSRKAGASAASGTYPQNSRTPGTYGPGE